MEKYAQLPFSSANVSIDSFMLNMLVGIALSLLIVVHYNKYAPTTAGKIILSRVLPYIALVTLLVISVVKSSLALSLGMVGALSVIRFRTAIKDPLELGYIFLCVAVELVWVRVKRLLLLPEYNDPACNRFIEAVFSIS